MKSLRTGGLVVVLVSGCQFDRGGDRVDVPCEAWGARAFFRACDDSELAIASPELVIDADATLDTTTGMLTTAGGEQSVGTRLELRGEPVLMLSVERFVLSADAVLRAQGDSALVIAAWDELVIAGELDVSSRFQNDGSVLGAGANPPGCPPADDANLAGKTNTEGGGGGGGGGFHGTGGNGGLGGAGVGLLGVGGPDLPLAGIGLRGGCPGGHGGEGDDNGPTPEQFNAGLGGAGGGALLLTAVGPISVGGSVFANGTGGRGQINSHRHGGGGGGSGGLIIYESPMITFADGALICANGGGGGGGANNDLDVANLTGQSGRRGAERAAGAPGEQAGSGGDGGAGDVLDGDNALAVAIRGAGGGGGGVGFVLVIQDDGDDFQSGPQAVVSPKAQPVAVTDIN